MFKSKRKALFPIVLLFLLLNAFFIGGKNLLVKWNTDRDVLIIGNALLFVLTLVSFFIAQRGMSNKNPHAFVRSVYGSVMVKLFVCIAAAFVYIAAYKKGLNKPAFFICMGLYLVYTFIEVSVLTKLLKAKAHA